MEPAFTLQDSGSSDDVTPLNIIRTETVLSRLPIHNLAKKGRVDIRITKRNANGQLDLKWEVSHSDRYGQPRQLAYKIDTLLINRRIEEQGKPIPKLIRLGTLSQMCKELGVPASGKNTNDLRKAIHQNAGSYITAKLNYRATDGAERRLEAGFSRYGVVFTGETLPDGRKADAVYIVLNDPYRDVLNNAPVRPLNYDYLRELRPAAQRFYEIISYRIFAALKHARGIAKLSYNDYCTYSAQQRYYDQEHFRIQMYKVHKAHLESGYLKSVHYDPAVDGEGKPDWIMSYVPGPKAKAEFHAFTRKHMALESQTVLSEEEEDADTPVLPLADRHALAEFTKRGVIGRQARKLLAGLAEGQHVVDQLEWGDYLIGQSSPGGFRNPPGFYVSIVRDNITPPASFESSRMRRLRAKAQAASKESIAERQGLELGYDEYCGGEIDRYIAKNLSERDLELAIESKKAEFAKQYPVLPLSTLAEIALGSVRAEIARQIPMLTFEAFRASAKTNPSAALTHEASIFRRSGLDFETPQ